MDKDVKLGAVGDLDIGFTAGKAFVTISIGHDFEEGVSVKSVTSANVDASILLGKLFDAIEKASPPGVVVFEEGAKAIALEAISKL